MYTQQFVFQPFNLQTLICIRFSLSEVTLTWMLSSVISGRNMQNISREYTPGMECLEHRVCTFSTALVIAKPVCRGAVSICLTILLSWYHHQHSVLSNYLRRPEVAPRVLTRENREVGEAESEQDGILPLLGHKLRSEEVASSWKRWGDHSPLESP